MDYHLASQPPKIYWFNLHDEGMFSRFHFLWIYTFGRSNSKLVFFEEMIYFEIQDCDMPKHCMDHILYLKYRLLILLPYHFNPTFPEVREYPESPYILSNVAKKLRVFHAPVSKVYRMWGQRGRLCTLDQLHTRTETDLILRKFWNVEILHSGRKSFYLITLCA